MRRPGGLTWAHALGRPLPFWTYPAMAVLTGLAAFARSRSLLSAPYAQWDITSELWHEGLFPVLAVIAGMATLVVTQVFRRNSVLAGAVRASGANRALATFVFWISAWVVLGLLAGLLPAMWKSARTATWGGLDVRDVLVAVCGVIVAVSLGVGLGAVLRHWVAALLTAVGYGTLMICAMSEAGAPLRLLQPSQHPVFPTPEFSLPWGLVLFQMTFGLVACVTAVAGGAWFLAHRRGSPLTSGVALTALLALAVTAWAWKPMTRVARPPVEASCAASPQVCVHPAHDKSLPTAVAVTETLRSVGGSRLFGRTYDDALFTSDAARAGALVFRVDVRPTHGMVTKTLEDAIALDLIEGALPLCGRVDGTLPISAQVTNLTAFEIARRSGISALLKVVHEPQVDDPSLRTRMTSMPTDELIRFVDDNLPALRTCSAGAPEAS